MDETPRKSWLHVLLIANTLLLLVTAAQGAHGMVHLALACGHMLLGIVFTGIFLFRTPFNLSATHRRRVALLYWFAFISFLVAKVLIAQIILFISLFVVILSYTLLFLFVRRLKRRQGMAYRLREFAEIPVFALVIFTGFIYFVDPGGPFIVAFYGHVLFSTIALFFATVPYVTAWWRTRDTVSARFLLTRSLGIATVISIAAFIIGGQMADAFGEQSPPFEDISIPITESGSLKDLVVDPAGVLVGQGCSSQRCHADIYRQWWVSPHRYSVNNVMFQKVRADFRHEFGEGEEVLCDRCHDPVGLFTGNPAGPLSMEEGVNCVACHSIESGTDSNGIINYRFRRAYNYPTRNLETAIPWYENLIYLTKVYHFLEFQKPHDNQACIPCHRVELPREFSRRDKLVLGDVVSPWVHSGVIDMGMGCISCHSPLRSESAEQQHARPDHVMFGTNQAIEVTRGWEVSNEEELPSLRKMFDEIWFPGKVKTVDWYVTSTQNVETVMKAGTASGQIFQGLAGTRLALETAYTPSVLQVEIDELAPQWPGGTMEVTVRTSNQMKAHVVPSGPLDMNDVWMEFDVEDAAGTSLRSIGKLDANFRIDPEAPRLGATPVNPQGTPIRNHHFWDVYELRGKRTLKSGESTMDRLLVPVPVDAVAPLTIKVRWLYRRYNQDLTEWAFPGQGRTLPVSEFGNAVRTVGLQVRPPDGNSGQ